jgi:4-amino-4-deoxy-L-arabinose transferase-like glycosyltransferase
MDLDLIKTNNSFKINNKYYWAIISLFTLVYIKGLFNLIYGIDANIYASISRNILDTGNWLEIYHKGNDYLDKPPLHFWLTAVSYNFFGVNNFAYKLPSFLFTILGTYSTFRLGKLLYSHNVGKLASLLFYSCFSIIMINQDVRTDTILVGIIVFAVWQLMAYVNTNSHLYFLGGFVGIGLAMLAKGPIGLMVPVLALGVHFIIKKQWSNIFKWQWILGLVIVGLVISPMLYGLYTQFDLQPNKEFTLSSGMPVKGISGLKFYFWTQSFGRITGDNVENWSNGATPLFFTHTYIWSFLPWSFIGLFALYTKIKLSFKNIKNNEFVTLGAIILPFIAFSMSSYKLPHYIYVFFPFWIIITANYLINLYEKESVWKNINNGIQTSLIIIVILVSFFVLIYVFPTKNIMLWGAIILFSFLLIYILLKQTKLNKIIYGSALAMLLISFIFNFHFIPAISVYDGPSQAAKFSKKLNVNNVYTNNEHSLAFDIYSNNIVEFTNLYSLDKDTNNNNYFFVDEPNYNALQKHFNFKAVYEFKHKGLTSLTIPFLNPKTREDHLGKFYLLEI